VTFTTPTSRPEPKRDRWGRYLLPDPVTGKERAWTRATTFAGAVKNTYGLNRWEKRLVVKGITERPDLYALAASIPFENKKKLNEIADAAKEVARGSSGSNLGTALHSFAQYIDAGQDITVPQPWDADLAAYKAKLVEKQATIHPDWIERVVLTPTFQVAGTFDRIITLPDLGPVIADLKTGQDLYYDDIPVQLALYANATHIIDLTTDLPVPMPKVNQETAIVIHLPAGRAFCEFHEIDIVAGWETAYICKLVRDWQARKDLARPYQGVGMKVPTLPTLDELIADAPTRGTLELLWATYTAKWKPAHTEAARARLAALEAPAGTTGGTPENEPEKEKETAA
jgi:hypothetical protein